MARIYQGGQSEKRYQGNARGASFSPTQVTNKNKAIKQQGDAAIRDLQTQDRESKRNEQMSAVSRRAQDATDKSQLQIAQQQLADQLRLQQSVDKNLLDAAQTYSKGELALDQLVERSDQGLKFSTDKSKQSFSQKLQKDTLALQDLDEKTGLGIESRALQANNSLASQALQAKQTVDNANRAVTQSIIQGLVDFGVQGIKTYAENKDKESKETEQLKEFDWLFSDQGGVAGAADVVKENSAIQANEIATEQAIQRQNPGSPIVQESIRGPIADLTMSRNIEQRDIGMASMTVGSDIATILNDPNTRINGKSVADITDANELQQAIMQVARQVTSEYGLTGKNAFAAKMMYGRAVKSAIAIELQQRAAQGLKKKHNMREGAAIEAASLLLGDGNLQAGYDTLLSGLASSGKYNTLNFQDIKEKAFDLLLERTPDRYKKDILNVLSKSGDAGTAFSRSEFYKDKIKASIRGDVKTNYDDRSMETKVKNLRVTEIERTHAIEMLAANGTDALAIRQKYMAELLEIDTLEATILYRRLEGLGGTNPNVYRNFVEGFESGNPPSNLQIANAHANKTINIEQRDKLLEMGTKSDEVTAKLKKAGLTDKYVTSSFVDMVANQIEKDSLQDIKGEDARIIANPHAVKLASRYDAEMRAFILGGERSEDDIFKKNQELMQKFQREVGGDPSKLNDGDITYIKKTGLINYSGYDRSPGHISYNPTTQKQNQNFVSTRVGRIPPSATLNDVFLTPNTLLEDVKQLQSGENAFSARTREITSLINVSPAKFLQSQAEALGHSSMGIKYYQESIDAYEPSDMVSGKRLLMSLGFSDKGASFVSGSIWQESRWLANSINKNDAADGSPSIGLGQWNMGRIKTIEGYLGKKIENATAGEQVVALVKEMQNDYPSSYAILTNPSSTPGQLERAIEAYWGYGDVGDRFKFAQQLIQSGGRSVSPTPYYGQTSWTGALTYSANKQAYIDVGKVFEKAKFQVKEHLDFGGVTPGVHSKHSYHKFNEGFDITHQTGDKAASIEKTRRLKEVVRSLNLFKEVIGPGDGDPNHTEHLHAAGLIRPITQADIAMINSIN